MLASHVSASPCPRCSPSDQLPANGLGKVAEDDPYVKTPAIHVGDSDATLVAMAIWGVKQQTGNLSVLSYSEFQAI